MAGQITCLKSRIKCVEAQANFLSHIRKGSVDGIEKRIFWFNPRLFKLLSESFADIEMFAIGGKKKMRSPLFYHTRICSLC